MRLAVRDFVFIIFQCFWILPVISQLCYDKTGAAAPTQYTCGNTADSACCSPGDICYSDGLCSPSALNADNRTFLTPFFWGGCTDPAYNTDNCFSKCFNKSGNGVQSCPNAGSNHYCCFGLDGCDCTDSSQVFTLPAANILTTIAPSVTLISSSSSTSSTSSISSVSSVSSTSTSSQVTSSPTTSPTNTPTNTPVPQKKSNNAVGIGVGVGVGALVVIGIIGAVYFLMRRRKKTTVAGTGLVHTGSGTDDQHSEMKFEQTSSVVPIHEMWENSASELHGGNHVSELHEGTYQREYYQEMPAHRSGE